METDIYDETAPASARMAATGEVDAALLAGLRGLDRSCGDAASKHDRAIVLIQACIDHGINTRSQIVSALRQLDFDQGHVAITLRTGTGSDPASYHWQRDAAGTYRNLN